MRRVFLGNEFDSNGFSISEDYCKDSNACGPNKIAIIDGSGNKKVIIPRENPERNYCLPKMDFAKDILNQNAPFEDIDFTSFIPIFEIIRDILRNETQA